MSFKAFDRQLYSPERVLHIQVVNPQGPALVRNDRILSSVGETTLLTKELIEVTALDPVNTVLNVIEGKWTLIVVSIKGILKELRLSCHNTFLDHLLVTNKKL